MVHLLVSELRRFQNTRCNDKKKTHVYLWRFQNVRLHMLHPAYGTAGLLEEETSYSNFVFFIHACRMSQGRISSHIYFQFFNHTTSMIHSSSHNLLPATLRT